MGELIQRNNKTSQPIVEESSSTGVEEEIKMGKAEDRKTDEKSISTDDEDWDELMKNRREPTKNDRTTETRVETTENASEETDKHFLREVKQHKARKK